MANKDSREYIATGFVAVRSDGGIAIHHEVYRAFSFSKEPIELLAELLTRKAGIPTKAVPATIIYQIPPEFE